MVRVVLAGQRPCGSCVTCGVCLQSDDPVDPKPELEAKCHEPCKPLFDLYTACAKRVEKAGDGTCEPWFFDYTKCVDKCVSVGEWEMCPGGPFWGRGCLAFRFLLPPFRPCCFVRPYLFFRK